MLKKITFTLPLILSACASQPQFEISRATVAPAGQITWIGEPAPLAKTGTVKVGAALPQAQVTDLKMKAASLGGAGKVRLISVVPSLDTPVCETQTHLLSETTRLDPNVERITISRDLPYAQRRFLEEAKLGNITYVSDYKSGEFGEKTGLTILRNDLLARAVLVVDRKGKVRYLQVVPEITQMPDMEKAFAEANALAREPST